MKELYVPSTLVMLVHCVDLPFMPTRDSEYNGVECRDTPIFIYITF